MQCNDMQCNAMIWMDGWMEGWMNPCDDFWTSSLMTSCLQHLKRMHQWESHSVPCASNNTWRTQWRTYFVDGFFALSHIMSDRKESSPIRVIINQLGQCFYRRQSCSRWWLNWAWPFRFTTTGAQPFSAWYLQLFGLWSTANTLLQSYTQ